MGRWIGVDVGKAFHWVHVLDDEGDEVLSRKVWATEEDIEAAYSEIAGLTQWGRRAGFLHRHLWWSGHVAGSGTVGPRHEGGSPCTRGTSFA